MKAGVSVRSFAEPNAREVALFSQEFSQTRFRNREVRCAQTFPNLFAVAERARIIAAGLVTNQKAGPARIRTWDQGIMSPLL